MVFSHLDPLAKVSQSQSAKEDLEASARSKQAEQSLVQATAETARGPDCVEAGSQKSRQCIAADVICSKIRVMSATEFSQHKHLYLTRIYGVHSMP